MSKSVVRRCAHGVLQKLRSGVKENRAKSNGNCCLRNPLGPPVTSFLKMHLNNVRLPRIRPYVRRRQDRTMLPKLERRPELDALRGLFLVWMTLTHLPTRYSDFEI